MPALDLTNPQSMGVIRNTTLGTAGNVRLVNLPPFPVIVTLHPVTTAAQLVSGDAALAEDAAIGSAAPMPLPADAKTEWRSHPTSAPHRLYLASTTSSQVVTVSVEKLGDL